MAPNYDAIIIGAGIIGANIGFELSKAGYSTLNIDKLPTSGYGSTANSCAIVRFSYSTVPGVLVSWEGLHYWTDWQAYLDNPMDVPFMPPWNRVISAVPDVLDELRDAVDRDMAEYSG